MKYEQKPETIIAREDFLTNTEIRFESKWNTRLCLRMYMAVLPLSLTKRRRSIWKYVSRKNMNIQTSEAKSQMQLITNYIYTIFMPLLSPQRNVPLFTCIACLWSCMLCNGTSPSLYWEKSIRDPLATIWKSNWSESSSIKLCAADGWLASAFMICTTLPSTCMHQ